MSGTTESVMNKDEELRTSKASFYLKIKTSIYYSGMLCFIIAFNLCILLNLFHLRVPLLILYLPLRLLTWGSEYGDGCVWRKFSEMYFTPACVLREYLEILPENIIVSKEFQREEGKQNAQFIFGCFPHGCGAEYRALLDGILHNVMPNIISKNNLRTLAASVLFYIPLVREISLWTSCINANRATAQKALSKQKSLLILPGGEIEQLMTTYGTEIVYLSKRKGFVKLAMKNKVPVVPMYVYGCTDYFYTSRLFYSLRYTLVKRLGICLPLCAGLFGSMTCPLPKKTTIVIGKPLRFTMKGDDGPTEEELNTAHDLFVRELVKLFDEHKERLGYGDRTLKVV